MFRISDARPADVEAIEAVRQASWLKTYPNRRAQLSVADIKQQFTPQEIAARIKRGHKIINTQPSRHTYVAKIGGRLVGFLSVNYRQRRWNISSLYLLPEYKRQGIGSRLLKRAWQYIGQQTVYLTVAIYNTPALKFYQKYGFRPTGVLGEKKLCNGQTIQTVEMKRII
jgi:ribosomal protein S18 acetylase RimI-like enzyme